MLLLWRLAQRAGYNPNERAISPVILTQTRDTLLSARAFERGYFRRDFIEDLFRKHEADHQTSYYGDTIWTFLAMELWHRQMADQPVEMSTWTR